MTRIVTGAAPATPAATDAAPRCTVALFGAGGDLAARLLVPSLYNLAADGLLPDGFRLLGLDRGERSEDDWKTALGQTLHGFAADPGAEFHPDRIDETAWSWLMARTRYHQADATDAGSLKALSGDFGDGSAIFYLALPAKLFAPVAEALGQAGLLQEPEGAFRRLVIEKPFGSDLASARALNARLLAVVRESQIFRIDHFMGKEPVQSILALRFGNRVLEPLLTAEHVASVEITAAETLGVEGRASFYEGTGALRDMVPNHLFQLLCMAAMDPPSSLGAEAIRDEKTRLLKAVRPVRADDVVFGQYGAGTAEGRDVPAYRGEPDVAKDSGTETFAALRLHVNNWRWSGTPFLIRTGKRMSARRTEIAFRFRPPPCALFAGAPEAQSEIADTLVLGIAPTQDVSLSLDVKRPGPKLTLAPVTLDMRYADAFGAEANVGYEALLYDAMTGDQTLFQRADTIEAAWAVLDPVVTGERPEVVTYAAGTDGPTQATDLPFGRWRTFKPI